MNLSFLCMHCIKRDFNVLIMPRDDSGIFELLAGAVTGFILVAEVDDVEDSGSTSMSGVADWQMHCLSSARTTIVITRTFSIL